eukprot:TRINITY_DN12763_c0_g1_i1.p1 TRINITY_DN12763_c0_g1~~TRINITY_DN12763_c0_g1_i1.p1  ORF type:complete len:265 (-),score=21.69 TRINITY_DN12763_c0_g1_i1:82-876(-)
MAYRMCHHRQSSSRLLHRRGLFLLICTATALAAEAEAETHGTSVVSQTADFFRRIFSWPWHDDEDSEKDLDAEPSKQWPCAIPDSIEDFNQQEGLEALLSDQRCPFVVAFFSGASPLSQSKELAITEQRLATSFSKLRYIRVDADQLGIKSFLQWDVSVLPTYILYWPPWLSQPGASLKKWHSWHEGVKDNPYHYDAVAAWISSVTGLTAGNSTSAFTQPLEPRGSEARTLFRLKVCWTIIAIAVLSRLVKFMLRDTTPRVAST